MPTIHSELTISDPAGEFAGAVTGAMEIRTPAV